MLRQVALQFELPTRRVYVDFSAPQRVTNLQRQTEDSPRNGSENRIPRTTLFHKVPPRSGLNLCHASGLLSTWQTALEKVTQRCY